jgi:hypothetical protein
MGPPFEAASCHALRNGSGSLAKFAAIRLASSFVSSNFAADLLKIVSANALQKQKLTISCTSV